MRLDRKIVTEFMGEVVHSTISQWTTQAWDYDNYPEFGSVFVCKVIRSKYLE